MPIAKTQYGLTPPGQPVDLYTLWNDRGMMLRVMTFGGRITEWYVPDRSGKIDNIVLGYASLEPYLQRNPYFGALCGRVANRIAGGQYQLDGQTFTLTKNDGDNTLHGGTTGFDARVWEADAGDNTLTLRHTSPDGDQGFGGTLTATVTYRLPRDVNELHIDYRATTDAATILNLTNHSYFNLKGAGQGDVLQHVLTLDAEAYTPTDAKLLPTGKIENVAGTPMDFRTPHPVGSRIAGTAGGYDTNFVLRGANNGQRPLARAAELFEPATGRVLEVHTTQPGLQVYTGNFLSKNDKGFGGEYMKHGAICLETQHFPDAIHHPNFPSIVLRPGQTYRHQAIFKCSTRA